MSGNTAMKRTQFSATYPDEFVHPLHERITESSAVTRAELLSWSPTVDATTLFWCDADRDATAAAVDAIDSLLVRNFVESGDGTYVFLRQERYEFAPALLEAIAAARVVFLPPVVFLDTGAVRFEAVGEPTALSAFHGELDELVDVTIESVHEFDRLRSPWGLTDRQRAALDAAVAVGYYEVPRDGAVADVAERLGCSTSTASELLRKAEAAVVQQYVENA